MNKYDKKPTLRKYNKSNDSNYNFYKYHDVKKFENLSFKSKYSFLVNFFNDFR